MANTPRDLVQAQLRSGTTVRTCWTDSRIRPGDRVTLRNSEDPRRWWEVVTTGARRQLAEINRGWNNNV